MFIPPSVMEGSKPEYRPEPFASAQPTLTVESLISSFATMGDSTGTIESQVSGGQGRLTWSVRKIRADTESKVVILLSLIMWSLCLLAMVSLLQSQQVVDIRRGLFYTPLVLWLLVISLKELYYWKFPERRDSILLDTDRLVLNPDRSPMPKTILYEQICTVSLPSARSGPVAVKYYLYDQQTGALNLSRLRSIVLPKTEDDAGLNDEILQRSSGPTPDQKARIGLTIWELGQIGLKLLVIPAYFLAVGIVAAIVT